MPNHPFPLCDRCPNPGTKCCSSCSLSRYCSRSCQRSAWPNHRLICTTAKSLHSSKRPTPASPNSYYRRAIVFPEAEPSPRFVWLKFDLREVNGGYEEIPDLTQQGVDIASGDEDSDHLRICDNPVLKRRLDHTLRVRFRRAEEEMGETMSVKALRPKKEWRGTLVCYAMKGTGEVLRECDDLEVEDWPFIVQWFELFGGGEGRREKEPVGTAIEVELDD